MDLKTTKKVGNYTLGPNILGSGSFSVVYSALDIKGTSIAAKVIPLTNFNDDVRVLIERQINCLKRCEHQNVVQLIDVLKSKNNFYIFMEYCSGGSLSDLLEKRGRLPQEEALNYFSQIVKGLKVLGAAGVVHRDLKSANLLISGKYIKIADFGLARKYEKNSMMNSYKGSLFSMAPEILSGQTYNQKVDVYSAGTILYQMLYGKLPYQAQSEKEFVQKMQKSMEFKENDTVSKRVKDLLGQMLEKDPAKRIDLGGVAHFLQGYNEEEKLYRLSKYRELVKEVVGGIGVLGAYTSAFNWSHKSADPVSMDLRLYGRLCGRLSQKA